MFVLAPDKHPWMPDPKIPPHLDFLKSSRMYQDTNIILKNLVPPITNNKHTEK